MKNTKKIVLVLLSVSLISILVIVGFFAKEKSFEQEESQIVDNSKIEDKHTENNDKQETDLVEDTIDKEKENDNTSVKYYYVSFLDDDDTILQKSKYKYGSIPRYEGVINNKIIGNYEYIFKSWTPDIHEVTSEQIYKATYSKTVIEEPIQTYTVSFDSQGYGIAPASQRISKNCKVTKPNDLYADNLGFGGWYTEDTYINKWNFDTDTVTRDMTLYARWLTAGLYANDVCYKELTVADCGENASLLKALITENDTIAVLPVGITSIANYSFSNCSKLSSITLPVGVTSIGDFTFENCTSLTSINFPEGLTSIGENALSNCPGLTSLSLPRSLSWFEDTSFIGCTGLESISVAEGNAKYDSRNNCNAIMQKETDYLLFGCKNTVMPSETKAINNYAFYYCTGLTSITIPEGVEKIFNNAFALCTNLTSITIPDSVTYIMPLSFEHVPHIEYFGPYEDDKPWGALSIN